MPPPPHSLEDLLKDDSGDDFDKMDVDPPGAVAPPEKAAPPRAMPPLDIPQPGIKHPPPCSLSGIGSIDNSKPPTPKRERTYAAFMETMVGKEYVQKFRNAGKSMVTSPKAGYKDGDNGVAVTYRFNDWGIGGFDLPGGKFYDGCRYVHLCCECCLSLALSASFSALLGCVSMGRMSTS